MVIYKTTNLVNGKIYIGQDSKNNPEYLGSGTLVRLAIKKYGKENFEKEILEECDNLEILNEREIFWIKELNSIDKIIGYNIHEGGSGGDNFKNNPNLEVIRKKMSLGKKGKKLTDEHKESIANALKNSIKWNDAMSSDAKRIKTKITRDIHGPYIFSPEHIKAFKESRLGVTLTNEHKKAISEANKGKKFTDEHKQKISNARLGIVMSDETKEKLRNINLGNKRSEETKKKISETMIGRKHSDETINKLKGRIVSDETKKILSEYNKGREQNNPRHKRYWVEIYGEIKGLSLHNQFIRKKIDKFGNTI